VQTGKIVVQNLYKVFGTQPQKAIELLQQGWDKQRILAEHGAVIGVSDVSFSVQEGEIFVLMGLSGSGKSTLIRLINRLVEPSAGDVFIDGQNVAKLSRQALIDLRRRDMSMVFQSFALMPTRCVLDNAAFGLEVAGVSRKLREKQALEVLAQVGLDSFADKFPHELSGGMQQRVGLARALAANPSIIIMDEAFSALDPLKRREMQDLLLDLQQRHQRTIIFVSHDIEEAIRIGTRIGIMEGGQMVQIGTALELVRNPANEYVRNFFDTIDTSRYLSAGQLKTNDVPLFIYESDEQAPQALAVSEQLLAKGKRYAFMLDKGRQFCGCIHVNRVRLLSENNPDLRLERTLLESIEPVAEEELLENLIERLMDCDSPLPVMDNQGRYSGAVSNRGLLRQLRRGQVA